MEVAPHLQAGDGDGRYVERAVEHRVHARTERPGRARRRSRPSSAPRRRPSRRCRCGSASPPSRARTIRRSSPSGRVAARRRAGRARIHRRCWCPLRGPRRRRRTSRSSVRGSRPASSVGGAGGLEHQLLVGDAPVVGVNPDHPMPTIPTRGSTATVIPWMRGRRLDPHAGHHRACERHAADAGARHRAPSRSCELVPSPTSSGSGTPSCRTSEIEFADAVLERRDRRVDRNGRPGSRVAP